MNQKLFTEWRTLYSSNWGQSHLIRLRIRMRDLVETDSMRHAVEQTMKRYPYFCVELKKDGEYYLAPNERPVAVSNSLCGVTLNTAESNYHLIAFSYSDNWIIMDISHAITDGTGAYAVIRTFLHYYVSERYGVELPKEGVRLAGDVIPEEEWNDPVVRLTNLPVPAGGQMANALNPAKAAGLEEEYQPTVYGIALSESEFMRFNAENNGSPATMVSLLLSRALYCLFPDNPDVIRGTGGTIVVEISAVSGRFTIAFIQPFTDPMFVNAFLKELDENGITYDLRDVMKLEMPDVELPWKE